MRALKLTMVLAGLLAFKGLPVYYNSLEFNEFVRQEAVAANPKQVITRTLLAKASTYELPITASDIVVTTDGAVVRVDVDYSVPINLFLASPQLKFHVIGSGLGRD